MSFANFSFSVKDYIEAELGGFEDSSNPNSKVADKKESNISRQNSDKNIANSLSSTLTPYSMAKQEPAKPNQTKAPGTYNKITPDASLLKYFSASPSAGHSVLENVSDFEKENDKPAKTRKYTRKNIKNQGDDKSDGEKPQKAKVNRKKTTKDPENDLHSFGEIPDEALSVNTSIVSKKVEPPIVEPPKILSDLSRPAVPSLMNKQKHYEFANVSHWTNKEFPWTRKLLPLMDHYFGYRVFRSNQKAIINATLSKRDVFVCMPTGGGKSLTFQLPAIVDKGVTIVVMPLLALIYDQVTQMEQKNIAVLNLSGGAGSVSAKEYNSLLQVYREQQKAMENWNYSQEMLYPKMIFITPEKIVQSEITMNFLRSLYQMGLLDRIVVDEAHCVSQWGRDFRKDYLNLRRLKEEFPKVCILALTATATEEIRIDIVQQLKMKDVLYFQNSFNRKNLIFEVRPKGKEAIRDVATFIEEYYPRKCGIIFTATVKEAEQVAQNLRQKHKIKTAFYHGQMPEAARVETQDKWMNDEIHVIVATIAFGMGINKLDVRFVIHFSFSKSISNYYQEAGRAGRDGQKAHCVIFYRYMDKKVLEFLNFHNKESSKEMKKENNWELMNIIKYCEDAFSCRRAMLLSYFGERFDKEECGKTCDNCRVGRIPLVKDLTEEAKIAVSFLQAREDSDYTMNQLVQVLSGRLRDKNKSKFSRETQVGLLKKLKLNEVEILVKELVIKRFFTEILKKQKGMMFSDYLSILNVEKKRAELLFQGKEKVCIAFPTLKRMESNEDKEQKERAKKNTDGTSSKGGSATTTAQPQQRIYIRAKPEENTVSNLVQKKAIDLESYAFRKSSSPEDLSKDDKKKFVYTKEYGYCTSDQFEDIVDRLKIVRKSIFNKVKQNSGGNLMNTSNLDTIIPIEGLYDLCRKLPTSEAELNTKNIKNIGAKQLQEHGSKFLDEIIHFVKLYQINKNEFIVPKEIDEEENKEVFDIQDHFAAGPKRDMDATMNEWNFDIFEDETRIPSVSKSVNRTDHGGSERGANPELDFNFGDFGDIAEEDWKNLERGEDDDSFDLEEIERLEAKASAMNNQQEKRIEENPLDEMGSDFGEDELYLIDEVLRKTQNQIEQPPPQVKPQFQPQPKPQPQPQQVIQRQLTLPKKEEVPVKRDYYPSYSYAPKESLPKKDPSFFDLSKPEEGNQGGQYIPMRGNQQVNQLKRERESDHNDNGLPKKLKQMKFL